MAKLLGQLSGSSCAGQTGENKHRAFPNWRQQRQARLKKTCYHSCYTDSVQEYNKVLMLCKFQATMSHFLFSCEMKFSLELARSCCLPKQRLSLLNIFLSVIGHWVKIWHRNKTTCSKLNPVQSSRSNSTTCPQKGRLLWLLRFGSNSLVISDGCAQKLGNYVRRDSESIATKVCSQISCKWNAMFESHVVPTAQRWQDKLQFFVWRFFEQSAFVNNHLLCYWPTIHNLISKICPEFQVISSHFFKVIELLDEHWAKLCKVKIFQLQSTM